MINIEIVTPTTLVENGILETGRFAIATKDMAAGSVIFHEESFEVAVDKNVRYSHCFRCGSEVLEKQCCPSCKNVWFCLTCTCEWHVTSGECAVIAGFETTYGCDIPVQCVLAFRIIHSQLGKDSTPLPNDVPSNITSISPFALVGSPMDNDEFRLESAKMMYDVILKCSESYSHLNGSYDEITLRTILQIIKQNAFRFGCGLALLPLCSLLNHSCAPNAVMTMEKFSIRSTDQLKSGIAPLAPYSATVRSLWDISAGEEVTISYRPLSLLPSPLRRELVLSSHGFTCRCWACCSESCDEELLGQQLQSGEERVATDEFFEGLTLDPLVELLNMAEEGINESIAMTGAKQAVDRQGNAHCASSAAPEDGKIEPIEGSQINEEVEEDNHVYLSLQFLQQAEFGIKNMALRPFHYLQLRRLALLAEASLLIRDHADVVQYSNMWVDLVESSLSAGGGAPLLRLCDTHLRCRMLVIRAESLVEMFQTGDIKYTTRKFCNRVVAGLNQAIVHAKNIYGDDYLLVTILQRKLKALEEHTITTGSNPTCLL